MGQVAKTIDVSLVSGTGHIALATLPSTTSPPLPIEPKPTPEPDKPSVAIEAAPNLGAGLFLKLKLEPSPPKTLTSVVADITSGGPSLTAEPASIVPHSTPMAPVPVQTLGGESCQILENLKLGLQASDAVKAALVLIPAKSLSVAKAIVLWDDRWIEESSVGGPSALEPIEQVVAQTVGQAPPNCQGELLHGVRFITLGDARDTTVVAFGSNDWRWTDVLATLSPTASNNIIQ